MILSFVCLTEKIEVCFSPPISSSEKCSSPSSPRKMPKKRLRLRVALAAAIIQNIRAKFTCAIINRNKKIIQHRVRAHQKKPMYAPCVAFKAATDIQRTVDVIDVLHLNERRWTHRMSLIVKKMFGWSWSEWRRRRAEQKMPKLDISLFWFSALKIAAGFFFAVQFHSGGWCWPLCWATLRSILFSFTFSTFFYHFSFFSTFCYYFSLLSSFFWYFSFFPPRLYYQLRQFVQSWVQTNDDNGHFSIFRWFLLCVLPFIEWKWHEK